MKGGRAFVRICASCKQVQEADGQWKTPEPSAKRLPAALITHGLCPACTSRLYPEIYRTLCKEVTP
jgi:hypothetical protein